jgi:hypothetical protein
MATAMVSFIGSLGEAFGVGIGGVIFQNRWDKHVQEQLSAGSIPREYVISYSQAEHVANLIASFPGPVQPIPGHYVGRHQFVVHCAGCPVRSSLACKLGEQKLVFE